MAEIKISRCSLCVTHNKILFKCGSAYLKKRISTRGGNYRIAYFVLHAMSLSRSAGIAVGFYGNGETCDGVTRLTYSLRHANQTVAGVDKLVSHSAFCFL